VQQYQQPWPSAAVAEAIYRQQQQQQQGQHQQHYQYNQEQQLRSGEASTGFNRDIFKEQLNSDGGPTEAARRKPRAANIAALRS
jgi:hypothetical protein